MTDEACPVRARIRAKLEAAGHVVGTVEAKAQAEWEQKVASTVGPLVDALKRGIAESPYKPEGE